MEIKDEKMLKPNEYVDIKIKIQNLISAYKSVNDKNVVNVLKQDTFALGTQYGIDETNEWKQLVQIVDSVSCSHQNAEKALLDLEALVNAFEIPSHKQIEKLFKKIKKVPDFESETVNLYEASYLGINDTGNAKKFLILPDRNGKLHGVTGDFDIQVVNGLCAVCQNIGNVSLFSTKVKQRGADGNYVKRGNYICRHTDECNHQLIDLEHLYDFTDSVTKV